MPNLQSLIKDHLSFYAENGFIIFPLNGKVPPKGYSWSRSEYNPFPAPEDFPSGNFGVKLAEDDLVLDIDPRNFLPEVNSLKLFQSAIDFQLKDATFTVKTGGGGFHVYFKKPAGWPVKGALKEYPGLEFKTAGQYLVGPGSVHPDTGKLYSVAYAVPIINAPVKFLELIKRVEVLPRAGTAHYVSDEQTKKRFLSYLKTAPVAVEGGSGDKTTFSVAAVAYDLGLHPDLTFELMEKHYNPQCQPPWSLEELKKKVYNAYKYSSGAAGNASPLNKFDAAIPASTVAELRSDQYSRIQKSVYNTVVVFNIDMPGMLALNIFSEDITFTKPAPWHGEGEKVANWTDEESARCMFYMARERRFEPSLSMIETAIINVARQNTYHPIKQYLEGIKWDGISRINTWLSSYLGVKETVYSRAVGLKMLVAAVTRIYCPGFKFDYIPVLEGAQGIGKSRALAVLGGQWYGDITIDVHAKDTVDIMRRLWIIEVSEMETQYRTETQALKSFLSRSEDICRLAYGRRSKSFPRQNIFIGTINPEFDDDAGYLKDTTGNRRYWPVLCEKINIDALKKVRDQLWAEALLYFKNNTSLHFEDTSIEEQALEEQTKRMGIDPWHDQIAGWLASDMNKDKYVFSSVQIYCDCLGGRATQFTRAHQTRISLTMRALKWVKGLYHSQELSKTVRGYKRP